MLIINQNKFRTLIFILLLLQNHLILAQSVGNVEWQPMLAWLIIIGYVALLIWIGFKFLFLKNLFQSKLKKGYFRLHIVLSLLISIPTFTIGFLAYWGTVWLILWVRDGFKDEQTNL